MNRPRLLFLVAFAAFVSLGLPDGVLGVAWPTMRATFGLPISRMGALLIAGAAGYLISSFFAGQAVAAMGVGRVLLVSTLLVCFGLVGYGLASRWEWLPICALLVGLGSGAVDAAINTVAAARFSPRAVTWMHACYGIGATLGPAVMTAAITAQRWGWRWGYGWLAAVMAVMATCFLLTLRAWSAPHHADGTAPRASAREALADPVVLLQVLTFFLYTGIEVTAGQWIFSLLVDGRSFSELHAGMVASGFWLALTAGRVTFGQLASRFDRLVLLRSGLGLAIPAAALICWRSSPVAAVTGTWMLGFALAPIYPLLISVTPGRVGTGLAAHAIGFQVSAATVGVAVLPSVAGLLARWGLESIPLFLLGTTVLLVLVHESTVARASGRGLLPAAPDVR